jgi:hypothetical protein
VGKGKEVEKFLVSCRELRISTSRKGCWRPPKSKQAGQVQDLVASKLNIVFSLAPLQNSKAKELLAIM